MYILIKFALEFVAQRQNWILIHLLFLSIQLYILIIYFQNKTSNLILYQDLYSYVPRFLLYYFSLLYLLWNKSFLSKRHSNQLRWLTKNFIIRILIKQECNVVTHFFISCGKLDNKHTSLKSHLIVVWSDGFHDL